MRKTPDYIKTIIAGLHGDPTNSSRNHIFDDDYIWSHYFQCKQMLQLIKQLTTNINSIYQVIDANQEAEYDDTVVYDLYQLQGYIITRNIVYRSIVVALYAALHDHSGNARAACRNIYVLNDSFKTHKKKIYNWHYSRLKRENQKHDAELKRLLDSTTMGTVIQLNYSWPLNLWKEQFNRLTLINSRRPSSIDSKLKLLRNNRFGHIGNIDQADQNNLSIADIEEMLDWMHDWLKTFTLVMCHSSVIPNKQVDDIDPLLVIKSPIFTHLDR